MRHTVIWFPLVTLVSCAEPGEPTASTSAATPSAITWSSIPLPACTRSWKLPVDGAFDQPGNWTPFGAPVATDTVCIGASGTYTVKLSTAYAVGALRVGGGRSGTQLLLLQPSALEAFTAASSVHVLANGDLRVVGTGGRLEVGGAGLLIDGRLSVAASCDCYTTVRTPRFENRGSISLERVSWQLTTAATSTNEGMIDVAGPTSSALITIGGDATVEHRGSVTGTTVLVMTSLVGAMQFQWNGGIIDSVVGPIQRSLVVLSGADLAFGGGGHRGRVDIAARGHAGIEGDVPPGVHVWALGFFSDTISFAPASGTVVTNRGTVSMLTSLAASTRFEWPVLVNLGLLNLSTGGVLNADSVINRGTVALGGASTFAGGRGRLLRNEGTIAARAAAFQLTIEQGAVFHAAGGSKMVGPLHLVGATLEGSGHAGDVTSVGGRIAPGPGRATLFLTSVDLDSASTVELELAGAGAGQHDVLAVSGASSLAGTLRLQRIAPFVGGTCGEVIPVITGDSIASISTFAQVTGLTTGTNAAWRLYRPSGAIHLVGYAPSDLLGASTSSIATTEGAGWVQYHLCLGAVEPTADVTVTRARRLGEIELGSNTLTWTAGPDWMLPRPFQVTAINDTEIEGAHADSVAHTITSADPRYSAGLVITLPVSITDNDGTLAGVHRGSSPPRAPVPRRLR